MLQRNLIGRIATNNRSVEHQFMKQFVEDNDLLSVRNPTEFSEEFASLFAQHPTSGSLAETVSPSSFERFSSYQDKNSIILQVTILKLFSILKKWRDQGSCIQLSIQCHCLQLK